MLKNKKLLLVPLVLSSEAVYAGSTSGVKSALSNYCVPYSDTYKETDGKYYGQIYNKQVCNSVFESIYKLNGSTPKCDCYENTYPNHSDAYPEAGKFLKYNKTSRRCEPTCPNRHKIKELSGCPDGTYRDEITKDNSGTKIVECEPCTKPANSSWSADTGCEWDCDNTGVGSRYKKEGDSCITCTKPDNSKWETDSGCKWDCDRSNGYSLVGTYCCSKPANSSWKSDAGTCNDWSCNSGYTNRSGVCCANKPDIATWGSGCNWNCPIGYYKNGNSCSACTNAPEHAYYTTENSCAWECGGSYWKQQRCIHHGCYLPSGEKIPTENKALCIVALIANWKCDQYEDYCQYVDAK